MPTAIPFTRPKPTISVTVDPDLLDLIDTIRLAVPESPSRSAVISTLCGVGLALMTDEDAKDAWLAHLIEEAMPKTAGTA